MRSALARILIFVAITVGLFALIQFARVALGWSGKGAPMPQRAIAQFMQLVVPTVAAYLFLVFRLERRQPSELAPHKLAPHGAAGTVVGVLLITVVIGVMWMLGSYHVTGFDPHVPWARPLLVGGLASAISEELVFRGVLFRISEERLGTVAALLLSGVLFGGLHVGNEGATVWSSLAIAIEAGLLLAMIYHLWRSLPLCMGVHLGWNFAEGTLYGVPVSGGDAAGLLVSSRSGPDWLSGGAFGAEASVIAVGLSLLCSLTLFALARRRGSIIPARFLRPPGRHAASGEARIVG